MKKELINPKNGMPNLGLFDAPVIADFSKSILKTKMGKKVPEFIKMFNLRQFMFSGITSKNYIAGIAIADIFYASKGFFYIYDINKKEIFESSSMFFPFGKPIIDRSSENLHADFKTKKTKIKFDYNKIYAKSKDLEIDVDLDLNETSPLRLCSKTSYNGWFFTKKQSSIPVSGKIKIKDKVINLDSGSVRGLTDRSMGFPGREIWWNWASTSTILKSGEEFGMNLSWGVNQTGETENIIWFNKKRIKINQASFLKNDDNTWSVATNDKIIDLKFYPDETKIEKENFIISATKFTQEIGQFKGTINIEGKSIPVDFFGLLEDHYVKW